MFNFQKLPQIAWEEDRGILTLICISPNNLGVNIYIYTRIDLYMCVYKHTHMCSFLILLLHTAYPVLP